jgi:hypothetical protein
LDYLFHDLLPREGFSRTFNFVRDRSRAVRNDFTMQHETGPLAIECHDRCARFHILALHFERERTGFSVALEEQQLMNSKSEHIFFANYSLNRLLSQLCKVSKSSTRTNGDDMNRPPNSKCASTIVSFTFAIKRNGTKIFRFILLKIRFSNSPHAFDKMSRPKVRQSANHRN